MGIFAFRSWRWPLDGVPLRVALTAPFLLLVLGTAVSTGYIVHHATQQTIEDLTGQLLQETGQRIEQNLQHSLDTVRHLADLNTAALRSGILDARNPPALEAYFFQQVSAVPTIGGVMLANEHKDFLSVGRTEQDGTIQVYHGARRDGLHDRKADVRDQPRQPRWLGADFDPHNNSPGNSGYAAVKALGRPHWRWVVGEIDAGQTFLMLARLTPFDDANGQFQGVTGVALYLSQLERFLQDLPIGPTGQAFIVDRDGRLIATSTGEPPFDRQSKADLDPEKLRRAAVDSTNPTTQAIGRHATDAAGAFARSTEVQRLNIKLDDRAYALQITPFAAENLDWRILVAIPEKACMGQIRATTAKTIALGFTALFSTLLLGLLAVRAIARPILQAMTDSQRVARGACSEPSFTSPIAELRVLSKSFRHMIAERKQTERELRQAMALLEREVQTRRAQEAQLTQARKLEAVGQLTGGIAHDFNNLLTVIKGNLELLRRQAGDRLAYEESLWIEDALAATRDGVDLTAGLLAFSRRQPLQPQRIRVNDLVRNLERLLGRVLGPTIAWRVETDPAVPDLLTDAGQLQSALLNLVINAQDAMPDGGTLGIQTAVVTLPGDEAPPLADLTPGAYGVITVTDSGVGMDAETLARACEPFFTTKATGRGTGLGLSIVHGFAAQSGGALVLASRPGEGASVRLFLPVAPTSDAPAMPDPPSQRLPASMGGSETILVVEDQPRVRRLASQYLRDLGYQVLEAADAEEALAILETEPELQGVFSDIVMPGECNGYDLAAWIAAHRPEVKCLLTTGYTDRERVARSDVSPPPPVLAKPYSREQLAQRLRQVLDG